MAAVSIDKILKEYFGETELKDLLQAIYIFVERIGWKELRNWSEFFAVLKPPQLNAKHLEQRVVSNFLHYRSNYILICLGISIISLILYPILLISLIALSCFSIYFLVYLKGPIKAGDITITHKGKRYICLILSLFLFIITGGITRMCWTSIYCILLCGLHMILRPRSVTAQANKAYEDAKIHGLNFFGIKSSKSAEIDPENPPTDSEDNTDSNTFGNNNSDNMRKRNFLNVSTPQTNTYVYRG